MIGIDITDRYMPGAIGRVVEMHGSYYGRHWHFGAQFESLVAAEFGAFTAALPHPRARAWFAVREGVVVGTVSLDAREERPEGGQLRWFIVDPSVAGGGVGSALLALALKFAAQIEVASVFLHTFAGLSGAHRVYERAGFTLTSETEAATWGRTLTEQVFTLHLQPRPAEL